MKTLVENVITTNIHIRIRSVGSQKNVNVLTAVLYYIVKYLTLLCEVR